MEVFKKNILAVFLLALLNTVLFIWFPLSTYKPVQKETKPELGFELSGQQRLFLLHGLGFI